jgi:hypothetical protein
MLQLTSSWPGHMTHIYVSDDCWGALQRRGVDVLGPLILAASVVGSVCAFPPSKTICVCYCSWRQREKKFQFRADLCTSAEYPKDVVLIFQWICAWLLMHSLWQESHRPWYSCLSLGWLEDVSLSSPWQCSPWWLVWLPVAPCSATI